MHLGGLFSSKGKTSNPKFNVKVLTLLVALLTLFSGVRGESHELSKAMGSVKWSEGEGKRTRVKKDQDSLLMHAKKGHPFDPLCDVCMHANMRGKKHSKMGIDEKVEGSEKGYVVGGDLLGPYTPDVDGNTNAFVSVEVAHTNYGMVELMKGSESENTREAFKKMRSELKYEGKEDRDVTRFHSDDDPSFQLHFRQHLVDEGIKQTDTGGHDPQNNSRTERRIGLIKERFRAMLFQCTAGIGFYDQLWGLGLRHANYLVNRTKWSDGTVPYTKLTEKEYLFGEEDYVFGQYVRYKLKKEHKQSE